MFPSVLSTFNRPNPTDRLNSPSHSALHNTVSSVIGQIEAVIGVEGANSVVGTLEYFIKSPDSNGGGHVQTANKGGTGQTSYTKGDLLVAQSVSVLGKLGVSSTAGDVLVADPNQSSGMKWAAVVANKVAIKNSIAALSIGASSVTQVLFSASILGSTLGINNAIRFNGYIPYMQFNNDPTYTLNINYGNNSILSMNQVINNFLGAAKIEGIIFANNAVTSQICTARIIGGVDKTGNASQSVMYMQGEGTASVNSSADQSITITGLSSTGNSASIVAKLFVVEKIV